MTTAIHLWIRGRVQGVFFRASTVQVANQLGLDGWVRNLGDGRVEVWAQGDEDRVDELMRWCHDGPPMARVDEVDRETVAVDPALEGRSFTVNHGR